MARKRSLTSDEGSDLDVEAEDEQAWTVNRILAERRGPDGITRYLVLWEGYPDDASTWEPADNFNDQQTLLDWREQVAAGDFLDDQQLAEVEARMETLQEREANLQQQDDERMADQPLRIPRASPDPTSRRSDRPENRHLSKRPKVSLSKHIAQPPSARNLQPSKKESRTTSTTNGPSVGEPGTRTHRMPSGSKFRNLKHIGNARKKAAQEQAVNPDDPNLKFVFGSNRTASSMRSPSTESLLFFPDTTTIAGGVAEEGTVQNLLENERCKAPMSKDHLVVFPSELPNLTRIRLIKPKATIVTKEAEASAPVTNQQTIGKQVGVPTSATQESVVPSIISSVEMSAKHKSKAETRVTVTAGDVNPAPNVAQNLAVPLNGPVLHGKNGLMWHKDDVFVHMSLGEHEIGTVRVVNLAPNPRNELFGWKHASRAYEIRMHFAQDQVLNQVQYRQRAALFNDLGFKAAFVAPFDQSSATCRQLARDYLEAHDLTALWYLPNSSLVFVMFSPRSPSHAENQQYRVVDPLPDLMLEVYGHRGSPTQSPFVPLRKSPLAERKTCRFWPQGVCKRGDSCSYAHDGHANQSGARQEMPEARPNAPVRARTFSERAFEHPMRRDRRRSLPSSSMPDRGTHTRPPVETNPQTFNETEYSCIKREREGNHDAATLVHEPATAFALNKTASTKIDTTQPVDTDWTFEHDYKALIKSIKTPLQAASTTPAVYIGFPDHFAKQVEALKTWARKHTTERMIFGSDEWEYLQKFLKADDPKLLFFHNSSPMYATLEDFCKIVYRDDVLCYNVSWSEPQTNTKPQYSLEPLFPRGQAVLLLEDVMVATPAVALRVLQWFEASYRERGSEHKMMVRPNIDAWLNKRMDELAVEGKTEDVECVFAMLQVIRKLSPVDITVPGRQSRLSHSIDPHRSDTTKLIPFPLLPQYDASPEASIDSRAIRSRDEFLVEHFIGFATDQSGKHRKFLVLHSGNFTRPEDGQHVAFRSSIRFVSEIDIAAKK